MSIAKNYIYNVIYQVFILIVPLITIPYVSKVLGSSGVGINAYTNSIIQYFILFGTIGIALYGNRSIAYVRDNKEELSRTFWAIFILKLITTAIAYLVFLLFLHFVHRFHFIFILQSIYIVSAAFDVTWLYMGLEDFRKTVIRNLAVKIIGTFCIFVFIRTHDDLWKYVLILSLSELFGQLTIWLNIPRTVNKIKVKWKTIKVHFMPALILFLPQVSIQIYAVLNKTMLGKLSSPSEVGFFDNADKIVKVILAVVTAMGVVMLPRISHTFAKGDTAKVREYLYQSLDFASFLAIPLMFGIAAISINFTKWYFPPEFFKTGYLIIIISPIIVLIAWSNVLGIQYLMPTGRMREFTISVTVGAIVNFIVNLILIHSFQSIGTAVATVIAEFTVTFVQFCFVAKDIKMKRIFRSLWKYLIAGFIMYMVAEAIGKIVHYGILLTMIQVIVGVVVYFLMLFLLHSETNKKIFLKGLQLLQIKMRG